MGTTADGARSAPGFYYHYFLNYLESCVSVCARAIFFGLPRGGGVGMSPDTPVSDTLGTHKMLRGILS